MKASAIRYLIDAGPLVGAFSLRDQWLAWSKRVVETLDEPIFTTELVFGEACHLLKSERRARCALIGQVTEKRLKLIPIWAVHGTRATELLEKYPQMDAGDASRVVLSELYPRAKIITVDTKDFTMYRRFREQRLPLIHPNPA